MQNLYKYMVVVALIALDQGIKLWVKKYKGKRITLINNFLYIKPQQNTYYSWFNSMLKIKKTRGLHIVLTVAILIFAAFGFSKVYSDLSQGITIVILEVLLIAGATCSLIDRVFWNGSLDYLLVKKLVIDLKDVYIAIFLVMFLVFWFRLG